jgi:hypothetical protein
MRKLTARFHRWRWGTLDVRRRNGLVLLHDVLTGTPIQGKYWMIMGLLLGCVRDGQPIKWDRDADFGFLQRDLQQFLAAVEVLRSRGFSLRRQQINNDGSVTKWALKFQGFKYEFFMFLQQGDRLRWIYHSEKLHLEVVNELPSHELDELDLYGRRWLKPANAEEYLTALYGDWRTPDPNYVYARDCRATVSRSPWSGVRRRVGP